MAVILASGSPRRKELLQKIVQNFKIIPADIDESLGINNPLELVTKLAELKAESVYKKHKRDTVIGSDTIVVIDGKIYGKPDGENGAKEMLKTLSGKTHEVYTAICVIKNGFYLQGFEVSSVTFHELSEEKIIEYIEKFSPLDKAGSYGIQDDFGIVKGYSGNYDNIMGFPLDLVASLLKKASLV